MGKAAGLSCFGSSNMRGNRVASSAGQTDLADFCGRAKLGRLCQFEAGEQHQIVGHHG
jgi:hypothetical protein